MGLRNEVKVRSDSLAAELSRQSESMIDQIDAFERNCLENFGDGAGLRTGLSKDTVEIGKYYNEIEEYLHSGGRLKVALTNRTDLVADLLRAVNRLDRKSAQYESTLFNNQMLSFAVKSDEVGFSGLLAV